MNYRCLIIVIVFVMISCLMANENTAIYLAPDTVVQSFDKKYTCTTERHEDGRLKLFIRSTIDSKRTVLIWSTERTLGVQWSPNSRWLAVKDNGASSESAILIFDLSQKNFPLIYQSPISKTEQNAWDLVGWDVQKKQVTLKCTQRFSNKKHIEIVTLSDKPIQQTLYDKDPRFEQ